MAPSTTRVLTDLGLGDKLLAVDTYSAGYQPELAALPQFDMMAPDAEQLAQLRGVSVEEIHRITTENGKRLYRIN